MGQGNGWVGFLSFLKKIEKVFGNNIYKIKQKYIIMLRSTWVLFILLCIQT